MLWYSVVIFICCVYEILNDNMKHPQLSTLMMFVVLVTVHCENVSYSYSSIIDDIDSNGKHFFHAEIKFHFEIDFTYRLYLSKLDIEKCRWDESPLISINEWPIKYKQTSETGNIVYTRRRKKTQHNMCWTPLCANEHK
jgi:hypothetical protein